MSKFVKKCTSAVVLTGVILSSVACTSKDEKVDITFQNVSVHDPAVIKVDDTFYITGSHMAEAKSTDLINWTSISDSVKNQKLFENIKVELKEALDWGKTTTFWASDWIKLNDGNYYLYYCVCEGSSPQGAIGYAVADSIDGPFKNLGLLVKSSGKDELKYIDENEEEKIYDANINPNAIDPALFYDEDGRLWMMYGSYSGGIYILEMNPDNGSILGGQGTYGKKILGGYHSEIEASYVTYNKEKGYYYLFLSFGGLTSDSGYNMRVARAKNPDGPYYDAMGNDMIDCKGVSGKALAAQNQYIMNYGNKLFGNFRYPISENINDESLDPSDLGYVSPGHNSVYYDEETGRYFLIFHTRFPDTGESYQVRVHQMYLNEDDWFVVSPYRYIGESIGEYKEKEILGEYSFINHGREIFDLVREFVNIKLNKDGTITGDIEGTFKFKDGNKIDINIDGEIYKGVFVEQYDINNKSYTMTFTVMGSNNGIALWGVKK
ncbi:glycoside hydrolase family 43 protein [Clostridium sp. D46t1_190503_E9]|uniref:glycoside hydrolase family 43 protein n=1 Tax=Clostridium sp. D46t1_190503_E9 TaxID=2787137 RepID=UPI00189AC076|nr:glycoside hydrolase family 43 protein [Clostridium sp. D46t1_190503_E9]